MSQLRSLPHKIVSILGARRIGKTSTLFQLMQDAVARGLCQLRDIVFLDIAELEYRTIRLDELHRYVLDQGIANPVYCLDEIQEMVDFDRQLIRLYNQGARIFITGSNSKLLSQELSTILRGRTYDCYQHPLFFSEFLLFRGYGHTPDDLTLTTLFDEYVMRGGYPEIVLTQDLQMKRNILTSYRDLLLYKDLIDRYNIRNEALIRQFLKSLILGNTKELNISKLFNTYKSMGIAVGKNTLYEYLEYLTHTFTISPLSQIWKKSLFDKRYCVDHGLMNVYSDQPNRGQKFESVIYRHLARTHQNLGYIATDKGEVDVSTGETHWQICWELTEENRARESAFTSFAGDHRLVTRYTHSFGHPAIQILSWKDVVLL